MFSKIISASLVLAFAATATRADTTPCPTTEAACCSTGGTESISTLASQTPTLSTLFDLVSKSPDATALVSAIDAENRTVFAPTDDAFATLLGSLSEEEQQNLDTSQLSLFPVPFFNIMHPNGFATHTKTCV